LKLEYAGLKPVISEHGISFKDDPNEIIDILLKYHPDLEINMNKEIDSYLLHLDEEEKTVEDRIHLLDIERSTYISNLKIMRNYKIQRAKNKIFYFHCIETIVETILKYKIKELDTPFNERFWHILQTIEGNLSLHKIGSNLKTTNDNDNLKAMLIISI
jgi:hypothetical protein